MSQHRKDKVSAEPARVRIALAQINTLVGGFQYNAEKIRTFLDRARRHHADVILFPELTLTGYPPEDLLLKKDFIKTGRDTLRSLTRFTRGLVAVIGYAEPEKKNLYNSAALLADGKLLGSYRKMLLPNYGVFDEKRYFTEGTEPARFIYNGITFGLTVCEDLWVPEGPGETLCGEGNADVLLNISSSPFHKGKGRQRESMIRSRARRYRAHVAYANLVGGQDELVFDGHSLVVGPAGSVSARGNGFEEELILADLEIPRVKSAGRKRLARKSPIRTFQVAPVRRSGHSPLPQRPFRKKSELEEVHDGLVLGTRDYIRKNGFTGVVIGLSGGVDSALTATLAVTALGAENVTGVLMPSPFSSPGSIDDSRALAVNLNIRTLTLPIEKAMRAYEKILAEPFKGTPRGIAEENLQARIRGNLLMALSNKMGWLVLTTGNKSEAGVGYCTLYGDMAGGFAVIKDVPKTLVYDLARWINTSREREVIPSAILTKEPSAELRPDQKDTDSLPPYPRLDAILAHYIEEDRGVEEITRLGFPEKLVRRVARMVDLNEYKRRQAPPGIKITPKAFGKDRRLPITNHYHPPKK